MKAHLTVIVLCVGCLLFTTAIAYPYIYAQVGVSSNFLIDDDRVCFVQSDGSLTVLNLQTGDVIARKKDLGYAGTLLRTDAGVVMLYYSKAYLLDPASLEPVWHAEAAYDAEVIDNRLLSHDGNGLVKCRDLSTGQVLWSYDLPGALDIITEKGTVLVLRSATYESPERATTVVLLDLKTGRELLRRTAPPGIHYLEAFFDGDHIYLAAGHYEGEYTTPNVTVYDKGRPSASFENLLTWDLSGNEIDSTPVPWDFEKNHPYYYDQGFPLAGKVFARGRVWEDMEAIPPYKPGAGRRQDGFSDDDQESITTTQFRLDDGIVTVTATGDRWAGRHPDGERHFSIKLESTRGNWKGTLPYLKTQSGEVVWVASSNDKLLLGTNLGHVECIDLSSGKSLWMYICPTIRGTMSYSSPRGMPPYMVTAAAIYKRENRKEPPESGMRLLTATDVSKPRIIFDPEPMDPFRRLPLYLALAWGGALLPLILMGALVVIRKRREWDNRIAGVAGIVLSVLAIKCFLMYGRVSLGATLALRLGMAVPLLAAFVYALRAYGEKHRISASLILACSLAIGIFIFPAFLRL